MITSEFIIRYTNALYSTPPEFAPRYDEFRDMFSSGQLRSKEWVVDEISKLPDLYDKHFLIAGAWFGTLGMMIKQQFPRIKLTMLDMDPRCEKFIQNLIYDDNSIACITHDMYDFRYAEDVIINTSCEHIPNVREWVKLLPKNCTIILQSNDFVNGNGHCNCVHSEEEFIEQSGLPTILYSGKLEMPMYTRYMIIGKT